MDALVYYQTSAAAVRSVDLPVRLQLLYASNVQPLSLLGQDLPPFTTPWGQTARREHVLCE
jgi:hypothetical protein